MADLIFLRIKILFYLDNKKMNAIIEVTQDVVYKTNGGPQYIVV